MKNRPVEKMLHPSSMHDYCEMAAKFGFTPFDREPDFDQDAFRKQWNEIKKNVKKDSSFQRVRTKYPDLLLNSKGTSRISISKGGDAVYPLVRILAPGFWHRNIEEDMPVYAPAWSDYDFLYVAPEKGMRRMGEKDAVRYLEWAQKRFGFFDILSRKQQHLDVMILDDADTIGQAAALSMRDFRTHKLRLGITLTFSHAAEIEKEGWLQYDHIFFHELSHILYCLRFDMESKNKIVPEIPDIICGRCIPGYKDLKQEEKHEIAVNFLTEGMLTGTEYEYLFCPHKEYEKFTEIAKLFFEKIVSEI